MSVSVNVTADDRRILAQSVQGSHRIELYNSTPKFRCATKLIQLIYQIRAYLLI